MTVLVSIPIPQSLAARFNPSPALARNIRAILEPHPDVMLPRHFTDAMKSESADVTAELEKFCAPVTMERLRRWLQPIGAQVAQAPHPDSDDYRAWLASAMLALDTTAIGAFNAETQKEALSQFTFWPSVAQIIKIVMKQSGAMKSQLFAAKAIANAKDPPPVPDYVPAENARDYVANLVQTFVAERSFMQPKNAPSAKEVKAAPLRSGALLASWRKLAAEGVPGAKERVEFLEGTAS